MNVTPISSTNFGAAKTVFRLPLKTGETAKISVHESEKAESGIKKIAYEIWKKGKVTEADVVTRKEGLDHFDIVGIMMKFNEKAKEGYEFFKEYSKARLSQFK